MFVLFSSDLFLVFYRKQNKAEFTFSFWFVLMYKLKVGLFLGPEPEIMAFITPPTYKFVHKQKHWGFSLYCCIIEPEGKKLLFIKYQFYPFKFF